MADGDWGQVVLAKTLSGSYPARAYLDGLEVARRRKLYVLFTLLANVGRSTNPEQFKKLKGKLFEFKRYQDRMPCFQEGKTWVITHGFQKKRDKARPSEIERAERIMAEDQTRARRLAKWRRPS